MNSLLAAIVFAGPWIQTPDFSQAKQEAALNATLRLTNPVTNGEGTAVRIGQVGPYVCYLTANHNLKDAEKAVNLESFSAASHPKPIRKMLVDIKHQWPEVDLALLSAVEQGHPGFLPVMKAHSPPEMPFHVLTVGCSDGKIPELIAERVIRELNGKTPNGLKGRFFESERQPSLGRSGGPLIDANGYLIGICSGTSDGKGYFVHLEEIRSALKKSGWDGLLATPPTNPKKPEK